MATVAYLLGAGASANCIPVVNGMAQDMLFLTTQLNPCYPDGIRQGTPDHAERLKLTKIFKVLNALKINCERHYSIDTYAKKLYLTDIKAFEKLKLDLSLYFTLKQIVTHPDKRYDNFFSSIMTAKHKLPEKVKIISWNYDYQLEKSYFEFNNNLELDSCQLALRVNSPKSHRNYDDCKGKFNVLKLNGSAKIKTNSHDGFLVSIIDKTTNKQVYSAVDKYLDIIESNIDYECELKFAWENENYESLFKKSTEDLATIEVLVIIGYSFPFYNRAVDKDLFEKMSNVATIYIQDCNPENIQETMSEFFNFSTTQVIYKHNLNQFVFPKELDIT